jgi:hypothetical protein
MSERQGFEAEEVLRSAYRAFNARDIGAAIELMDPAVDWPNAWEGGRVVGRAAVRDYWNRQFASMPSKLEPEGFTEEADGSITVDAIRWSTTPGPVSCSPIRAFATAIGSKMASSPGWTFWSRRTGSRTKSMPIGGPFACLGGG